jgi:hypothetical protein
MAVLIVTIIVVAALDVCPVESKSIHASRAKKELSAFPNRLRVSAGDFGSSSRLTSRWSGRGNRRSRELGLEV